MMKCQMYFPIHVMCKNQTLFSDSKTGYVFVYEPHDIFPVGIFGLYNTIPVLTGRAVFAAGSSALFCIPFMRQIWSACNIIPVDKESVKECLSDGYNVILTPGGVKEVINNYYDVCESSEKCNIKKIPIQNRKGFVKIALQHKKQIVPIIAYGQGEVFNFHRIIPKCFSALHSYMKFTPIAYTGRWNIPLGIPFQRPIHVHIGTPISIDEGETVDSYHKKVCDQIYKLYRENTNESDIIICE